MPPAVAESGRDRLPERNTHIFDRVMLIDVEISRGIDGEIETAVSGDQFQHVIEKPDPCADLVASPPVERELQDDRRLGRLPSDHCASHSTSSIAPMHCLVCSTMPAVIRMQPLQPKSADRSRT